MSAPRSLLEELARIPDPRSRHGLYHPLPAILGLAVVAMLAGARSYEAIAQFGRDKGAPLAFALGFRRSKTPVKSRFSTLFRLLDITAFEAALSRWIASRLGQPLEQHVCLDGKTARGSKDGEVPGQHLVAAYVPAARAVLAQLRVDAKTNEHKAALELLGILPLQGRIFTGDAMFCQRDLCRKIVDGGGDYVFIVKDNQPGLAADIDAGLAYDAAAQSGAAFSPRGTVAREADAAPGPVGGQGPRSAGEANAAGDDAADQASGLEGPQAGLRAEAGAYREGEDHRGGGAGDIQPEPRASRRGASAGSDAVALGDRERLPLPA